MPRGVRSPNAFMRCCSIPRMPEAARKALVLVFLAAVWEAYARWLNNPLLFPTRQFSGPVRCAVLKPHFIEPLHRDRPRIRLR